MGGRGSGFWKESRILCIVGVAGYQVAEYMLKSFQKDGESLEGIITAEPALMVLRREAMSPSTWYSGMT